MSYFSGETLRFLRDLSVNNDKLWFADNKQRYEQHVREPALAFISDMQSWIKMISPYYEAVPKKVGGSLMRVYRDVRFSADKSPFKTNIGIQFRHELGKDVHAPGFYFHLHPEQCFLGVGVWHPAADALKSIRDKIANQSAQYQDAITHQPFCESYQLSGESLQRPPRGYDAAHPLIEEIKRKDFIGIQEFDWQQAQQDDLCEWVARQYGRAQPLQRFLCDALNLRF